MNKCAYLFVIVSSLAVAGHAAELTVSLLENNILCVRAHQLTDQFVEHLRAAEPTNHVSGIVLDLRFANGNAINNDADYFSAQNSPVVILVNSQTRGAAAALAMQLRATDEAIIIGSTNPPGKIVPDIAVVESTADEKMFQENPFSKMPVNPSGALPATNDLFALVDHTSEAELVRKHIKDGDEDGVITTLRAEPSSPVIRDPALARALDLLKALAVLHQPRG